MNEQTIEIEKLYQNLLNEGNEIKKFKDYELIDCSSSNIKTRTLNGWVPVRFLSRHKTTKHLVEIVFQTFEGEKSIKVTTDHVCMVFSKEWILEEKAAKDIRINDYVDVLMEGINCDDSLGTVIDIKDLGPTEEYVYDMEMDDENIHWFFVNDILVHNSQFIDIHVITDLFIEKYSLPIKLMDWPDEYKLKLWKFVEKFVMEKVNMFVHDIIKNTCYSEQSDVLGYSLEYIADSGLYEQKKRYCIHKMVEEGPALVNKFKYSGIELKRANVPPSMKEFLKEIYESTVLKNWTSNDYENYLKEIYVKYAGMDINDISFWYTWNSDKIESTGFLEFGKGTTAISKACHAYNQLLDHLKLGKKYESINVGDKIRLCVVFPNNVYGIETIAFPASCNWPSEFDEYFRVDYKKMFEKTILKPLKSFRKATNFADVNPANVPSYDIFSIE